jgi:hypothetical protein
VAVRARRGRTAPGWRLADLSLEDRIARGRAARRESPRSGHARWEPAPGRPDPVTLLQEQAATRVPELVPIRYGRMLVSPGTFYRGVADFSTVYADQNERDYDALAQAVKSGRIPAEMGV